MKAQSEFKLGSVSSITDGTGVEPREQSENPAIPFRRRRVLMDGIVFAPKGAFKVRISEVSKLSTHVWTGVPMEEQCDVIFKKGRLFIAGRVIWASETEALIRFYRELSEGDATYLQSRIYVPHKSATARLHSAS